MAWTMPAPPDQLIQLLRRRSPMAPAGALPPPGSAPPPQMAFGPQPTPQTVAQNQPPIAQPQPVQQAPAMPPPSDNPDLSPVKAPDLSAYAGPLMEYQKQQADLNARRKAVPDIDPNQTKPKLWERLLGIALGATQLRNPENAGAVAGQVVNRRKIGAEDARNEALRPINEQQDALDKQLPFITAAQRAAYEQAELGQRTDTENTSRWSANRLAKSRDTQNDEREKRINETAAQNEAKNKQAQDVLTQREQNDRDRNTLTDRLRSLEEDRRANTTVRQGTPGQFSGVDAKREQANATAHTAYNKATADLPKSKTVEWTPAQLDTLRAAKDDYDEAEQSAQNAWENEVRSLGGTTPHSELASQGTPNTPAPVTMNQRRGGYSGSPEEPKEQAKPVASAPTAGGTAQHFDYASQRKVRPGNTAPNPGAGEKVNELGGRKVGDIGVVRGQRVRITAIYKNGKFDYEPVTAQ
jgi:hypothetical protein